MKRMPVIVTTIFLCLFTVAHPEDFCDEFDGSAIDNSRWTIATGTWSQSGGQLIGSWPISNATCDNGNILLADAVQPSGDFVFEVDMIIRAHGSYLNNHKIRLRNSYQNVYSVVVEAEGGKAHVRVCVGGSKIIVVPEVASTYINTSPGEINHVRFEKTGVVYSTYINGHHMFDFEDEYFNGDVKLGFGCYGSGAYERACLSYGGSGTLVEKIAFVSDRRGDRDIWMMNPDGSQQEPLISWSGSYEVGPSISPDGLKLAFVSNRDADYELFVYDFQSKNTSKVPTGLGWCYEPSWSPDGTHIAVSAATSYSLCGSEIYTVKLDGTDLQRWTTNGVQDNAPCYSPDGNTIAFHRVQLCFLTYSTDIFKLDLTDGSVTRCTFTGNDGEKDVNYGAKYSPGGGNIVWEGGDRVTSDHQIWIMDSDCGSQQILGGLSNRLEGGPSYSPNGDYVVYHGWYNYQPPHQIYRAPVSDISSETQLTSEGDNTSAVWGQVYCQVAENQPPSIEITCGPTGIVAEKNVTFCWTGTDSDGSIAGFEYELDGAGASTTATEVTFMDLEMGTHTFRVRAIDDDAEYSDWAQRDFAVTSIVIVDDMIPDPWNPGNEMSFEKFLNTENVPYILATESQINDGTFPLEDIDCVVLTEKSLVEVDESLIDDKSQICYSYSEEIICQSNCDITYDPVSEEAVYTCCGDHVIHLSPMNVRVTSLDPAGPWKIAAKTALGAVDPTNSLVIAWGYHEGGMQGAMLALVSSGAQDLFLVTAPLCWVTWELGGGACWVAVPAGIVWGATMIPDVFKEEHKIKWVKTYDNHWVLNTTTRHFTYPSDQTVNCFVDYEYYPDICADILTSHDLSILDDKYSMPLSMTGYLNLTDEYLYSTGTSMSPAGSSENFSELVNYRIDRGLGGSGARIELDLLDNSFDHSGTYGDVSIPANDNTEEFQSEVRYYDNSLWAEEPCDRDFLVNGLGQLTRIVDIWAVPSSPTDGQIYVDLTVEVSVGIELWEDGVVQVRVTGDNTDETDWEFVTGQQSTVLTLDLNLTETEIGEKSYTIYAHYRPGVLSGPLSSLEYTDVQSETIEYVVDWREPEEFLSIQTTCPVDIAVTDPFGNTTSMSQADIPYSYYLEDDFNGDGETDDRVTIYLPVDGVFSIDVFPDDFAGPLDTYSLIAVKNQDTSYLAIDQEIGSIPAEGYVVSTLDTGSVHGVISSGGSGLHSVPVDLYNSSGVVLRSTATGEAGDYCFAALDNGDYSVSISTPLGYQADAETKQIAVRGLPHEVNFDLTELEITPQQRSRGYWAHQLHKAMQDKPKDYSIDDFSGFVGLIEQHFNQNRINPLDYYSVLQPAGQTDSLEALREQLHMHNTGDCEPAPKRMAKAQLIALMLNLVSGKVSQTHQISEDGRTVSQLITYCDMLISDEVVPPDNEDYPGYGSEWYGYVYASFMLNKANIGLSIPAGMIPEDVAEIAYRVHEDVDDELIPRSFALHQNYPNPFNPSTKITVKLPEDVTVSLIVYNITGQKVEILCEGELPAGTHTFTWDGTGQASGVYFYRLRAGSFEQTKKMILMK